MQAPVTTLKVIIFVHFTLTAFGTLSRFFPNSYAFVQVFYLALGFWGLLQTENPLPIEMMLTTNIISIILDIIILSVFFPTTEYIPGGKETDVFLHPGIEKFAGGMIILNLLLKPFAAFLIYKILQERGGEYGNINIREGFQSVATGLPGRPAAPGGVYQNIDPVHPEQT